jgi:hypothetical protein
MNDMPSPIPKLSLSYAPVLEALTAWNDVHSDRLSPNDIDTLREIERRIQRLQPALERLLQINAQLITDASPKVHLDQETDTISIQVGDQVHSLKLNRANPDTPVSLRSIATTGAYRAGGVRSNDTATISHLKSELEGALEQYYYNAHRVLKLIQQLPGLRNFKCKEIIIVRNKLVEHADHGDIYSFGFGSAGPVVRPMVRPGRVWTDQGLLRNTEAFVNALLATLSA